MRQKRKEGTNLSSGETKEMEEREKKKVKLIEEKRRKRRGRTTEEDFIVDHCEQQRGRKGRR